MKCFNLQVLCDTCDWFLKELKVIEDEQGITCIDDLSVRDLNRIRTLALIELTALYDQHGIVFIRHKGRMRTKGLMF